MNTQVTFPLLLLRSISADNSFLIHKRLLGDIMPIDSVGSYDDIYSDENERQALKSSDTCSAEWFGRTVLEAQDDRRVHSILEASLGPKQTANGKTSANVCSGKEKKYESISFSIQNGGYTPSYNPSTGSNAPRSFIPPPNFSYPGSSSNNRSYTPPAYVPSSGYTPSNFSNLPNTSSYPTSWAQQPHSLTIPNPYLPTSLPQHQMSIPHPQPMPSSTQSRNYNPPPMVTVSPSTLNLPPQLTASDFPMKSSLSPAISTPTVPILQTSSNFKTPSLANPLFIPESAQLTSQALSASPYKPSTAASGSLSSHPAPLVMPTSLIYEPKTYSTPALITDIPKSSSYATSYKGTPTLTNHLPKSSQPTDLYRHGEFSLSQPNGINPNALHSSLFPGYQEPQTSHLSSMPSKASSDQKQNAANISKAEAVTEFTKGFLKGLPQGSLDSIKKIPSTISTIGKAAGTYVLDPIIHPLNHILPGQELIHQAFAVPEAISDLVTCNKGELFKAVAPEVHTLFTNWDNLSYEERGSLMAHCFGEYGTDFVLLPAAAAKGAKLAGGLLKEASTLGRIEGAISAATKEVEAVEAVIGPSKLAKGSSPLAAEKTIVQQYLASEELRKDLAEVLANTEKALGSKTFAEGKAFTEELTAKLNPLIRIRTNGIWEIEGKTIKRFSPSTELAQNKLNHIFENGEHNLNQLGLTREKIMEKITEKLVQADIAGEIPANVPFKTLIELNEHKIEVRGIVIDGELRYGTIFIPE